VPVNGLVAKGLYVTAHAPQGYGHIVDENRVSVTGILKNLELLIRETAPGSNTVLPLVVKELKLKALDLAKPICALHQRVNSPGNTPYVADHNIGYVTFTGNKVENSFLIKGKKLHTQSWDFASDTAWSPP
jgi:hypothetical protein